MARRIIIPARYASTRLPAKLLIEINGKTILEHTYRRALSCGVDSVLIATDHPDIVKVADQIGAPVCLTASDHPSGSDRCAEAMQIYGYQDDDIILNLQGDEPLIPRANLLKVLENLEKYPAAMVATLCEVMTNRADIFNPTYPKVVFDREQYALYFSRAPIPWARDAFPDALPDTMCFHRHIGLYAYRGRFLREFF